MVFILIFLLYIVSFTTHAIHYIDFDQSMKECPKYDLNKEKWNQVKKIYNENFINKTKNPLFKIPKIIHQIWVGSPLPEKCKAYQRTWQDNHPSWEYILWTDKTINEFGLENQYVYNLAKNPGEKSDIARYEILYRIGGLYVDTDFESIKPMDYLHENLDFYAGIAYGESFILFNGLIAASPGHPILKECVNNIKACVNQSKNKTWDIMERTGPFYFTSCFEKIIHDPTIILGKIVVFPVSYFYPWPNHIVGESNPYHWLNDESFAIHHWHSSWMD